MLFFFFFKQKTAYEIYQCDWSSDVCSSDLQGIANDDYTFKFPQSAPFGGRVSAGRTNEIAGAAGVGLIVKGLFGVKPGRDGSIRFSTGRRSAEIGRAHV